MSRERFTVWFFHMWPFGIHFVSFRWSKLWVLIPHVLMVLSMWVTIVSSRDLECFMRFRGTARGVNACAILSVHAPRHVGTEWVCQASSKRHTQCRTFVSARALIFRSYKDTSWVLQSRAKKKSTVVILQVQKSPQNALRRARKKYTNEHSAKY